jgi:hypothetical protein
MKVDVRLQPTELRMECDRVASATLEKVLPCSLRLVLHLVILGPRNVAAMHRGLFFNSIPIFSNHYMSSPLASGALKGQHIPAQL